LPALCERKEDIPFLAQRFLEEFSGGAKVFDDGALAGLQAMPWKGNVRELRNCVERVSVFVEDRIITVDHITKTTSHHSPSGLTVLKQLISELLQSKGENDNILEALEKEIVGIVLDQTGGNITQAARLLGIDRKALARRFEKHSAGQSEQDT
jgi:two-component system response regulator HydG